MPDPAFSFFFSGHENILATHGSTLEFTKDTTLTKQGDCILGIKATWNSNELGEFVTRFRKGVMKVQCGEDDRIQTYSIWFHVHKEFNHDSDLILRTSWHEDDRTFGIGSSAAADDISRELITCLSQGQGARVECEGINVSNLLVPENLVNAGLRIEDIEKNLNLKVVAISVDNFSSVDSIMTYCSQNNVDMGASIAIFDTLEVLQNLKKAGMSTMLLNKDNKYPQQNKFVDVTLNSIHDFHDACSRLV